MTFYVTTTVTGPTYYLRRTIWTDEPGRATPYATKADAVVAIAKAKQFNPKAAKSAKVIEVAQPFPTED